MRNLEKEAKQLLTAIKQEDIKQVERLREHKDAVEIIRIMTQMLSKTAEDPKEGCDQAPHFKIFQKLVKEAVDNNNLLLTEVLLTSVSSSWVTSLDKEIIRLAVKNNNFDMLEFLLLQGIPIYRYPISRPSVSMYLSECQNTEPSKEILSLLIKFGIELDGYAVRSLSSTNTCELDKIYIRESKDSIEYFHPNLMGSPQKIQGEIHKNLLPNGIPAPFEKNERKIADITSIISKQHHDHLYYMFLINLTRLGDRTSLGQKPPLKIFSELTTEVKNPTLILSKLFIPDIANLIAEYWIENHQEILNMLSLYNVYLLAPLQKFFTSTFLLSFFDKEKSPEMKQLVEKMNARHFCLNKKEYYLITPKAIDEMIRYYVKRSLAQGYNFIPGSSEYQRIAGFLGHGIIEALAAEVKQAKETGIITTKWSLFAPPEKKKSVEPLLQTGLMEIVHYVGNANELNKIAHILRKEVYQEAKNFLKEPSLLTTANEDNFKRLERFKNKINEIVEKLYSITRHPTSEQWISKLLQIKGQLVHSMQEMLTTFDPTEIPHPSESNGITIPFRL